ncbi:MAG: amidase [Solirubrobacterales bacterium]|nr:amidase [Solirubrobacterales bacterium]
MASIKGAPRVDFTAAVARTLERIEADRSGAVVTICREAVEVARCLDRAAEPGALAGVPFTAKDVLASAGTPSQAGSRALAGHVPDEDAPAIALLRAAGAVLVGKTNCSELALTPWTGNELFGETRHPFAPGRSPGGSSGGCAAAIAAGLVPLSLGTDYGGSVRLPAAACGIVALRPTPGRIPASGQLPPPPPDSPRARFSLVGPLARDVGHLHAALVALDPGHASALPSPLPGPVALGTEDRLVRAAAAGLALGGAKTVVASPPFMAGAEHCFTALRDLDTYEDLRPLTDRLGPGLQSLLTRAPLTLDAAARAEHRARADHLRRQADEFMASYPLVVLPVSRGPLPPPAGAPVPFDDLGPCRAVSLLGLPAVAVRGVQIVARRGQDEDALAAAALLE